jgi:hypothetical protein
MITAPIFPVSLFCRVPVETPLPELSSKPIEDFPALAKSETIELKDQTYVN